ncbi:MAG: diphthine--ammonia ligase [Actinomycetota bacterium]
MERKALVAWSGGKDSALALHRIAREDRLGVEGLLTTVTASYDRITMHGVRKQLLERQAESLGLPLLVAEIPAECGDEVYDRVMGEALDEASARGIEAIVFGDIFLEDVRRYREERLARAPMEAVFPLWGEDTGALAREFIDLGFRAVLTCVDSDALDGSFAGREYDGDLLADLPPGVDPCGENGEFHTFVWDGPGFARPLAIVRGEVVVREARFHFQDLM